MIYEFSKKRHGKRIINDTLRDAVRQDILKEMEVITEEGFTKEDLDYIKTEKYSLCNYTKPKVAIGLLPGAK